MTDSLTEAALFELLSLDCHVDSGGGVCHYNAQGQLHRVHGPAVEQPNRHRSWWHNGQRHRIDGPAVEGPDGYRGWWQNGKPHRLDGPAVVRPDGSYMWFINGRRHTEAEWQQVVASMGTV